MQNEHKSFDAPDEVRNFPHGKAEIVRLADGGEVGRYTFEPGWRWSQDIKPLVGGDSCQVEHMNQHVSGRLHIVNIDGTEFEGAPGDVTVLGPGHDAWVVGNEPVVVIDWRGAGHYAKAD
jgi:hypothetical protein